MFIIKNKQNGFTLIEILLVMLITSILVLGINTAFRQTHMLWSRTGKQRPIYQKTRLFFNTMRDELTSLYMPKFDDQQPAPFMLSTLPEGTIRLSFFTLNPAWKNTAIASFPSKVSYEISTASNSGQIVLSRTEQLFSGQIAVSKEQKETILDGFSDITVEAADPSADDLWKSNLHCSQFPPKAVKILLKWQKSDQAKYEFETIINITSQGQIIQP